MSYNKIIVGIGMLVMCQYSCTSGTPAKYKNKIMVSVDIYDNNKQVLTDSIREFILTNTSPTTQRIMTLLRKYLLTPYYIVRQKTKLHSS